MQKFIPLIGRIFISIIFLMAVFNKFTNFSGTEEYMKAYGMPMASLFLVLAIIFELFGALSILIGFKAKWGALILIIFLVPTTLIFHTKFSDQMQMIMFMKNLAIIGGLLMISYFGAGDISIDSSKKS